ncbi:phosphotransferase enzyme family protein [Domibacillus indicus]|uniref:phosphotransferase enzyme family protein n=1 Tax=Domibacillus indicus TaxID=1437523 RepID=UPI000617ECDE|nr:aminoglycoside phosphotransferase family protein [Domibacillus indicus]
MADHQSEEELAGGNVSRVSRVGDTVRREVKPVSPHIHKLLLHLENKGFSYAPRFLGMDGQGREILSFIEGEAGHYPLKKYMWSKEVLAEIAGMLRLYHEAVCDFPFIHNFEPIDRTPPNVEVLCHNDFAVYNIIFNGQKPVGIIDFDTAGPGPKIWDIAYTVYTCLPLSRFSLSEAGEPVHYTPSRHASSIKERLQLFFEAYDEKMPPDFLEIVLLRLEGLCRTIRRKAGEGDPAFQKMIDEGHLTHYQDDIAFIREHGNEWIEG